ncbi:Putative O-methyltransferase YrrM OS=Streptomyces albaduncus OX=68172 GN=FHS32_006692 PE=4 SV=1 [Streptomyces griseoloalbus]
MEVRVGPALRARLAERADAPPLDLVFIDADKANNPHYVRVGAAPDGRGQCDRPRQRAVRGGRVADPRTADPDVVGARTALEMFGTHPRLDATAVQTVGAKDHDGFALARVAS